MALKIVEAAEPVTAGARVTGAAMDQSLPKRRPHFLTIAISALALLGGIAALSQLIPHGLRVTNGDIRIASVRQEMFHNDVVVRSTAEPLHTIMLDALESGRVEEVLVNDGALVAKDALLFRLSNPQLRLNLVAREADRAQQISNLSILRVSIETSQTEHQRRMLELHFAVAQAEKQYTRNASLAKTGVIAAVALEESQDRLAQQRQALEDETTRAVIETRIKREGVKQMEQAVERLDAGLQVVNESLEALDVHAPIAGRLTDFRLQLGEIVKPDQHIGRIDDPSQFKLVAQIDEYYLGGVSAGKKGNVTVNGRDYAVEVSRVFPQIKDGRFSLELLFTNEAPSGMNPGQSAETRLTLGETSPGLVLPNDAFLNDSGGTWVFVLSRDGRTAERRTILVGRRNNSQVAVASGLAPGERVIVSTYAGFGKAERLQIAK
jgi:HlyD family secretion protein